MKGGVVSYAVRSIDRFETSRSALSQHVSPRIAPCRTKHERVDDSSAALPINSNDSLSSLAKSMFKHVAQIVREVFVVADLREPVVDEIGHRVLHNAPQRSRHFGRVLGQRIRVILQVSELQGDV